MRWEMLRRVREGGCERCARESRREVRVFVCVLYMHDVYKSCCWISRLDV